MYICMYCMEASVRLSDRQIIRLSNYLAVACLYGVSSRYTCTSIPALMYNMYIYVSPSLSPSLTSTKHLHTRSEQALSDHLLGPSSASKLWFEERSSWCRQVGNIIVRDQHKRHGLETE